MMENGCKVLGAIAVTAIALFRQRESARKKRLGQQIAWQRKLNAADQVILHVDGMMCQKNCGTTVQRALSKVPGVLLAEVDFKSKLATVLAEHEIDTDLLVSAVEDMGFGAKVRRTMRRHGLIARRFRIEGMMCEGSCVKTVERALQNISGVEDVKVSLATKSAFVLSSPDISVEDLIMAIGAVGFEAHEKVAAIPKRTARSGSEEGKVRHHCFRNTLAKEEIDRLLKEVPKRYRGIQLGEYSRYKDWSQSSYMECHPQWIPQVEVVEPLREIMAPVLSACKERFHGWYSKLHNLEELEVVTLNSFVTKYIPQEGKSEFGKHVDGAKVDGSLILSLPTDEPHDWPGLVVWDYPRDATGELTEYKYELKAGDVCVLDNLVLHHGLPITKGARYVLVCFYKCKWKKVKM